jgi:hydrogenase maturation protein HypF
LKKISTWHIHIKGQVQGVGFRPFVYQLAQKFYLKGWVNNTTDGVHIAFNSDDVLAKSFYDEIIANAPQLSHITSHGMKETALVVYEDFQIISSSNEGNPVLLISPDFAMCEDCRKEIKDKNNRRYNYAFTTCTQCGPRYSIFKQLPYDRDNTTMEVFKICNECKEEYNDPLNRRHFSQTNSCPNCPVVMNLYDKRQNIIEEDQYKIINKICALWNDGKIVAIKGIGGYLLTCDASNVNAIKELRLRKHRPTKPFALMFLDLDSFKDEVHVSEYERKELLSTASPVVLLKLKEGANTGLALAEIAPRLPSIGVMLPYTPLYELLLQSFKKPIVTTSGNISTSPIVYKDEAALKELNSIADFVSVNDREILVPQDDSVIKFTAHSQQKLILRRARGFAPLHKNVILSLPKTTILALGAQLKSSFTFLHQQNIHISQYLGDMESYDAQKNLDKVLHYFLHLFNAKPAIVITDNHPDYFTSQLGEQLANKWGSVLWKVQHHEAHFSSVLGEHHLLDEEEKTLGVIWDGTGLGNDGQIWGGEFFIYYQHSFSRVNHFEYFDFFLGDKMAMEPRLSAFSICYEIEELSALLKQKFSSVEWTNYLQLIKNNKLKTSSLGRIVDAVASILGLIDKLGFEGEAAMLLEEQALHYFKGELNIPVEWLEEEELHLFLSPKDLMRKIIEKVRQGKDKSEIAAWFHVQLVLIIKKVASVHKSSKICFSGGVFQNGLLVDLLFKILSNQLQLFFNKDLSPNDENISFGQLMSYIMKKELSKKIL